MPIFNHSLTSHHSPYGLNFDSSTSLLKESLSRYPPADLRLEINDVTANRFVQFISECVKSRVAKKNHRCASLEMSFRLEIE